jgi:hypothetical protein
MNELDDNYKMLLNVGFIVLREALQSGSTDWVKAEIEMLHNVPSLIGETNALRHEYYWEKERTAYVEWIKKFGSEYAQSRMAVFYEPIWESISKEIESQTHKKIGAISA